MKKLLPLLCFLFPVFIHAALPSNTTTWEVRTLGASTNGGCYVTGASGTDFSQQNGAQFNGTDLVIAATTTNVTSVSHSFVATDVGNCVQISAGTGFTVGFYEIVSVATGIATLDRSAGVAASTGGTWAEGGAVASPQTVYSNAAAGNTAWVKADGTYTFTSSITFNVDSIFTNSFKTIGYTSARGDGGRATWTTATNSVNLIALGTSATTRGVEFDNLTLSNTAGTTGFGLSSCSGRNIAGVFVSNTLFTGFSVGIEANSSTGGCGMRYSR